MGFSGYFNDNWNKLDFLLVVLSLILSVTMSVLRISKNLVSSRGVKFLRISKNQRMLRLVSWMKRRKVFRWLFAAFDTLSRIKIIIVKAAMCITSFKRITSVMTIVSYIYAVIGTEILKYSESEYNDLLKNDPNLLYYEGNIYGNFKTFESSIFSLFQILTESSWHMVVLYHELFHGFWVPCIFLLPFHMFITFILRSILLGLTWEVFAVVNEDQDYLVKSIQIDKEFSKDMENEDFADARMPLAHRLLNAKHLSVKDLTATYINSEKFQKQTSEFDKLYKEIFTSNKNEEDYKNLHRFVRRSCNNSALKYKDILNYKKLQRAKNKVGPISLFRTDLAGEKYELLQKADDDSIVS